MNYRDFYRKEQALAGKKTLVENVDFSKIPPEILKGAEIELEHTPSRGKKLEAADEKDIKHALKTSIDHYKEDKHYYKKLTKAGLEECGDECDNKPAFGGMNVVSVPSALDVPSRMKPVSIAKIVSPATCFGTQQGAGNAVGSVPGDKEKITAAGQTEDAMTSKSVGGSIIPNKGQKQGGPNTQGNIAGTPKEVSGASGNPGQKGPNSIGSTGGTPVNPNIGQGSFFKSGIGMSTNQSYLGQFNDPETENPEDEEEEGEEVKISLNESIKRMIRDVVTEVVKEVKGKKKPVKPVVKKPKAKNPFVKKNTKKKNGTKKPVSAKQKSFTNRFKKGGDLYKEVKFISRKINEGRELTDTEKSLIKEMVLSSASRMREELDTQDYRSQETGEKAMLDSYIETSVKYRSKEETPEDIVNQIVTNAEEKLGISYVDNDDVEQKVKALWNEYPARF